MTREQKDAVNALVAQMGQHARSGEFVAVMALANDALPDDDPRKITHEKIVSLREVLSASDYMAPSHELGRAADEKRQRETDERWRLANELLDAIESLLPPDVTTYTQLPPEG